MPMLNAEDMGLINIYKNKRSRGKRKSMNERKHASKNKRKNRKVKVTDIWRRLDHDAFKTTKKVHNKNTFFEFHYF